MTGPSRAQASKDQVGGGGPGSLRGQGVGAGRRSEFARCPQPAVSEAATGRQCGTGSLGASQGAPGTGHIGLAEVRREILVTTGLVWASWGGENGIILVSSVAGGETEATNYPPPTIPHPTQPIAAVTGGTPVSSWL